MCTRVDQRIYQYRISDKLNIFEQTRIDFHKKKHFNNKPLLVYLQKLKNIFLLCVVNI